MIIPPFKLEQYFRDREFTLPYHLSSSDCEPVLVKELLARAHPILASAYKEMSLGYTESQGHPVLREKISRMYDTVIPDEILTVVPEEGIYIAMRALLNPGDNVIVTCPGYQSLYTIAEMCGCTVTKWFPRTDQGWHFDPDDLAHLVRENTKMIVVNFPHNPTGALPTKEEFTSIVEVARAYRAILFSDEMYRGLEFDPNNGLPLPAACDTYENAVSLTGFSKVFGLAGLRLGWLATKNREYMGRLVGYKDFTTICGSAPSELLGIMALEDATWLIECNKKIIRENLDTLRRFLDEEYPDIFSWTEPKAGSVCFPRFSGNHTGFSSVEGVCNDLESAGVMLVPGSMFEYPGNYFRIGLGRESFLQALDRFRDYLFTLT